MADDPLAAVCCDRYLYHRTHCNPYAPMRVNAVVTAQSLKFPMNLHRFTINARSTIDNSSLSLCSCLQALELGGDGLSRGEKSLGGLQWHRLGRGSAIMIVATSHEHLQHLTAVILQAYRNLNCGSLISARAIIQAWEARGLLLLFGRLVGLQR